MIIVSILCDIYCRVSTTEQAVEGFSLGEQESRLRAYAQAQGWVVHAVHIDPGFSGAKLERPGIQAVIRDAQSRNIQKVLTYKLDRLSRSQKDTLYLIEDVFLANGVDYVSATESLDTGTPFGKAMLGILSVFAQLEREQIAERMMMGRIASAKEGNWRGGSGVPIGYRYTPKTATDEGRLVVEPDEAEIVRDVFRQFLAGQTFHAIYSACREKYHTSYGKFAGGGAALIPAMLSNRVYVGDIKYCGEWYPGKHESIIDRPTFDRVQDKLVEYRAGLDEHRRQPFKAGHLLTGFLFCGECGARWCYHSCSYRRADGERVVYGTYTCYTKNAHKGQRRAERCSIPVWSADELEELVWEQILALRYENLTPSNDADTQALTALERKIQQADRQLLRLVDLYALGTIPFDVIQSRTEALTEEKERLQEQLAVLRRNSTKLSPDELRDTLLRVEYIRAAGTLEEQRDLLRLLIDRIELHREREVVIRWKF